MRRLILCAVLLACAAAPVRSTEVSALQALAWLGGCWRAEGGEPGSGEQWLPLAGGSLLGVSRTVKQGQTVAHEFMQIRQRADGSVVFIAQPSGQAEASFVLQPGGPGVAVFENLQHDFPQRVIYRLEEGGRLRARIEGQRANGALKGIDFPLQRVACDPPAPQAEAFQGLPWGASEPQLLQRFGSGVQLAECVASPRRGAVRVGEACKHPTLAPYTVAGVPFRLNLHVDETARRLVRVSMFWDGPAPSGGEAGFSEKHRQLRQLLTQRYGSPENTHVDSTPEAWNATARWRVGATTVIELMSTFQPRAASNVAREQVEIVYQPITAGEAGKL